MRTGGSPCAVLINPILCKATLFPWRALPFIFALLAPVAGKAQTQTATIYDPTKYILVDARLLRGAVGYSTFGISEVDTLPARQAQGINERIEARLVSGLLKHEEGFVIADAFFLDLTFGRMSSEPLYYYDNPESRFSMLMQFGYSFLAGYSTEKFGVLAGKSFNWSSAFIGGTSLPGVELLTGTGPWMMRAEMRPAFSNEFRIMLTGWDNFNNERRDQGFRVDIPFLPKRRLFLTYELGRRGGDVSYATFDNDQYSTGVITQHLFGLRFGSIY